jgi:hypothetical protein
MDKLRGNSIDLLSLPSKISRGSSTGNDDVFMLRASPQGYATREGVPVSIERGILRTPIYATDFGRYRFDPAADERVIFPYVVSPDGYRELEEKELISRYPLAYAYLKGRKPELTKRKQFSAWYSFSAPRNLDGHLRAQLMVPLLANKGLYCALPKDMARYCPMASGGFTITIRAPDSNPLYALGLLNSRLLYWVLEKISNRFRGGWITCTKQYVGTLPIRRIDFSQKKQRTFHDRVAELSQVLLRLQPKMASAKTASDKTLIQRQVDSAERQIDRLVYELYGLTDEEIATVENSGGQ